MLDSEHRGGEAPSHCFLDLSEIYLRERLGQWRAVGVPAAVAHEVSVNDSDAGILQLFSRKARRVPLYTADVCVDIGEVEGAVHIAQRNDRARWGSHA